MSHGFMGYRALGLSFWCFEVWGLGVAAFLWSLPCLKTTSGSFHEYQPSTYRVGERGRGFWGLPTVYGTVGTTT